MANGDSAGNAKERRSKRIFAELAVRWVRAGAVPIGAVTGDINTHGLFVRTDETAAIGQLRRIEVDLPDGPLTLHVVVRSVGRGVSGTGVGLELLLGDPEIQRRWESHYESLRIRSRDSSTDVGAAGPHR